MTTHLDAAVDGETSESPADGETAEPQPTPQHNRALFVSSAFARGWLWFLAGCLLVTLIPTIFGWRPYVVQSGSMSPRINIGDVVLAAPAPRSELLPGRVVVFDDPDVPGRVLAHRIARIDSAGRLITKGDANPSADPLPVPIRNVHGLGRLLVRFVGLPWIWARRGEWLLLLLFVASIGLAGWLVARDREQARAEEAAADAQQQADEADGPNDNDNDNDNDSDSPDDDANGDSATSADQAATPSGAGGRTRRFGRATLLAAGMVGTLLLPLPAYAAFNASTTSPGNSWAVPVYSYPTTVVGDGPYQYYRMDDNAGTTAADSSGNGFTGTYNRNQNDFTFGVTGGLPSQSPNKAVTFTNANSCLYSPAAAKVTPGPTTYTIEAWFKTTSGYSQGGKLAGYETARTGVSDSTAGGQYDRHVYMDGAGHIWFGVWTGAAKAIESPVAYNDGAWHYVVATMSAAGMVLYLDGVKVASDPNTISQTYAAGGWWRVGCGNLSGWGNVGGATPSWTGPNVPSAQQNYPFLGSLDEVAIYQTALTAQQVAFHYWIR